MKPVKQVETSKVIFEHFQTLKMIYSTNLDGIYQRSSLLSGNVICFFEDLPSELKDIPKKACDRRVSFEFLELIKLQFCYIFLISIKVPSLFL
ncbi:hypothetical protein HanPI659440_Chr11g0424821 [Helianthus annuus]|nr:hypothetical protein HanPI659440_Chr11g0424821 [Helianthus annuus]